ncbi:MAG: hypothetical protein JWP97_1496 [Labilithrix sp.]|nr:hypothetical protein [Labilithrix sp.]
MNVALHLLLGVLGCGLLGLAMDRALVELEVSAARWALRVVLGVVTIYLALSLPVVAGVTLVALLALRLRRKARVDAVAVPAPEAASPWLVAGVIAAVAAVVALRPAVVMYWDEYVWLAKARLGSPDPRALVEEALELGTNVVPVAYPLLHPLAVASLAGFSSAQSAVVAGAEALTICCAATFVLTAIEASATRRALALAAGLGLAPLVMIHLRSAYVDLETGMLTAALALMLERRRTRSAAILALAVVGLKDEGIAHVLAMTVPAGLLHWRSTRRAPREAIVVFGVALVSFAAWHLRVVVSGVGQSDHAMGLPQLSRLSLVLSLLARQATDITSWGPLWIVVAGLVLARVLGFVKLGEQAGTRLAGLALQATFLFGAIASGNDRVASFAASGTLVPRLLVQLAPMAVLVLTAVLTTPALSGRAAPPPAPGSPTAS